MPATTYSHSLKTQATSSWNHAVVLGASIAGLLAARVLLNHFDRVTLIERDRLSEGPLSRPGVPQGEHVHVLLLQGQKILEELFPGITNELIMMGAIAHDWIADWQFLAADGWLEQHQSGLQGLCCSRVLLEWSIRKQLLNNDHLMIRSGYVAQGVVFEAIPEPRITGVNLRPTKSHAESMIVSADLVVDAMGRNSDLPDWLKTLGYATPPETHVNSFLGYASRWYRRPTNADTQSTVINMKPGESSRGGILYPVEGDRWGVTLTGIAKDYPPKDGPGFLEFAKSLRSSVIYDLIKEAQPCSPISCYRRTENQWRHYEHLSAIPRGIVALGDAVCCFNPVYGQGMTASALGANTLNQCLLSIKQSIPNNHWELTFQKQLAHVLQTPWLMATGEDFRWDITEGKRPGWLTTILQGYFDRMMNLSQHSPEVHRAFLEVIHLLKPPTSLFSPTLLFKALTHMTWQSSRRNRE